MTQNIPDILHTGSLAGYHTYALRLLPHNYVNALNISSENTEAEAILNHNAAFEKSSQSYQHIVE